MLRTTKTRVIGLALAGAVVLSGGIYATTALAIGGSSTDTAPTQQAPSSTAEWRAGMLDMLQDHMGLSGQAAEDFADEMSEHMQGFDQDFDLQEIVDWCNQYGGPGSDGTYGPGMMDEGTYGPGMMDEDFGYGGYGMMGGMMNGYYSHDEGWGMMDTATIPETGSTQSPTPPASSGSQQGGTGYGLGKMMSGRANDNGSIPQDSGMMGSAPAADGGSTGSNSAGRNSTSQMGGTPDSGAPTSSSPGTPAAPSTPDANYGNRGGGMMGGGMMMQGPGGR
jgi:hypothetical protein